MAEANEVAKLIELTKDIKITMFTTVDSEGHFVSRPMAQHLVEPDGDLWFFAERNSRLIEEISWVEAWLPQGPTDPSVVLIKVNPHTAEYWDTPGGPVASLLSFVKAKVTGEPYQGTDRDTVNL